MYNHNTDSRQKYEYAAVTFDTRSFFSSPSLDGDAYTAKLNEYGSEGWEVVSVFDINRGNGETSAIVVTFKRLMIS